MSRTKIEKTGSAPGVVMHYATSFDLKLSSGKASPKGSLVTSRKRNGGKTVTLKDVHADLGQYAPDLKKVLDAVDAGAAKLNKLPKFDSPDDILAHYGVK